MRLSLFILSLIFSSGLLVGQDVTVIASGPNVVANGEAFYLKYQVNAQATKLVPPSFGDFDFLGGPSTSTMHSYSNVNGVAQNTVTYTYTYTLRAKKEGKFKLNPAIVTVGGKEYSSNSITIDVAKANQQSNQNQNTQNQTSGPPNISGNDLYLSVLVNRTNIFQGEYLVATVKLFSKVDLVDLGSYNPPTFNGFLKSEVEQKQLQLQKENVNGNIYNTVVIAQYILTPQKSGKLIIEPSEIECVIQYRVNSGRRSLMDEFFGRNVQRMTKKVRSSAVSVVVNPLPGNKPNDFNGTVGKFNLESSIDKNELMANEAITLTYTVKGKGNLELIDPFQIKFPHNFEVYDPKIINNVSTGINGSSGSKTFEYLVIPRHAGNYTIPEVKFSYFDLESKTYKQLSAQSYEISVAKGDGTNDVPVISGVEKEDLKYIGKDIRHIKTNASSFERTNGFIFGSSTYFLSFPAALLAFILIVFLRKNHIKKNSDIAGVKNKKAKKIAEKRLRVAHSYMNSSNSELFYDELLKAIWGYFSDKFNIPLADLSREKIIDKIKALNQSEDFVSEVNAIIDTCEFARYAPSESKGEMNFIYSKAVGIIGMSEKNLKQI
ncbi:MAG: protein BatD [Bacteroidales bacterium]|nr:protein BatD [Bacteroidales bacterium]